MWDSGISLRGQDSRSRTWHSLVLDRSSNCPLGGIPLSYTRNNEWFYLSHPLESDNFIPEVQDLLFEMFLSFLYWCIRSFVLFQRQRKTLKHHLEGGIAKSQSSFTKFWHSASLFMDKQNCVHSDWDDFATPSTILD